MGSSAAAERPVPGPRQAPARAPATAAPGHGCPRAARTACLALAIACAPAAAWAQGLLSVESAPGAGGGTTWSVPIQTLLVFTALSFLPAVLLMMTGFTRIVIVLSLMRQALGLQTTPPNQVIIGLSLFLTFFVMAPTLEKVHRDAYEPYARQEISFQDALERAAVPMRAFMAAQTRESELALFARVARIEGTPSAAEVPMRVLIPAFVTSELKTAFQIGFLVFVPFLVIDLIVASLLMSMGMMMVSPVLVALPFKLMLFVLADGWNLLVGSLVTSFGAG